jgi:hypothetical protein
MNGSGVLPGWHPAPASRVTLPVAPVPGSLAAARETGARVGKVHGEFRAWFELFIRLFNWTGFSGQYPPVWSTLSPKQRLQAIAEVQRAYTSLPTLPSAKTVEEAQEMRKGFAEGAKVAYEANQFMNRAVWAACELAKAYVTARASVPSVAMVRGFSDLFSDCAAQTASRAILEMTGVDVPASYLVRTFGLPRASIDGYEAAVAYARNWFAAVGLELAPRAGGLLPVAQGGVAGRYVLFLKGGARGGHVVFADLTASEMRVIDNQLGSVWTSVAEAERALGMKATTSSRIVSATVPQ